jgi:hypothetical protein
VGVELVSGEDPLQATKTHTHNQTTSRPANRLTLLPDFNIKPLSHFYICTAPQAAT